MQTKNISATQAVEWYKKGWSLFTKDIKTWVLMTLIMLVGGMVLSFLPIIGQIVIMAILPALIGGLLYAAQQASEGNPIKVEYLWSVLASSSQRNQFLALGGIIFAAAITIAIVSAAFIGDSLLRGANTGLVGFGLSGMLFLLIVGFASFVVFYYTPALMLFRKLSLFDALKTCVKTASTQVVPLLVFFLIYTVLAVIGSIPFGLGMLVVAPVTAIALYFSYLDVFAE